MDVKFGSVTHFASLDPSQQYIFLILKMKDGGERQLEKLKIVISQQRFDRSPQNLAR